MEFEISQENEIVRAQLALDSPFRFEEPLDSDLGVKINNYKDITVDKLLAFLEEQNPEML